MLGALSLLCGCGAPATDAEGATQADRIQLVATVGMVADIVREVAGEQAEVTGIIGEGVDPHLYTPTREDVVALSQADAVYYVGLHLEGKMADVLKSVGQRKPVLAVGEAITEARPEVLLDSEGKHDPHLWMDVRLWRQSVPAIAAHLSEHFPQHATVFAANAEALTAQFDELAAYAEASFASIPESQRILVTAHDAFNYLGKAHGLEVRGIQGISTESEAGVRDIEQLINFLVESQVPAVFVETSVSDKNVRALVEGCAARGHPLRIGGSLFSDAMGKPGTYTGTYLGMLDHNITAITRALGGHAPASGWQGKLVASGSQE